MDKIYMNELSFYGYHGVLPEENKLGQLFLVTLILGLKPQKAGLTDSLQDTVNYAQVYEQVKEITENKRFKLIESLAEAISQKILKSHPILKEITVKVIKPNPPIPGHYHSVAIEITRKQGEKNG